MFIGSGGAPRIVLSIGLAALRAHRMSACLLALLAGAGVAVLMPLLGLFAPLNSAGTTLRFSTVPAFEYDLGWTGVAVPPNATQLAAVSELFELLFSSGLLAFFVIVCSMLLVAGASAGERAGGLAIHRAVGASRRMLFGAAVAEAAVLAAFALAGGGVTGAWLSTVAVGSWPGRIAGEGTGPAPLVLAAGAGLLLAAFLPLLHRGQRRLTSPVRQPPGLVLPAVLLGMTLTVLSSASMISVTAERLASAGAGRHLGAVAISTERVPGTVEARAAAYERLVTVFDTLPGVDLASLTSPGQSIGLGVVDFLRTDCGVCPRGGILLPWLHVNATIQMVSSDTFHAAGFGVVSGRGFRPSDRFGSEPVAIVNRHLAARYFEEGKAVGRDLFVGTDHGRARHRVIGIVDDTRSRALGGKGLPLETLYLSILQHPPTAAELVLAGTGAVAPGLAAGVASGILGSPVHMSSSAAQLQREAEPGRWFARWFGIQGWVMLAAAMLGITAFLQRWVQAIAPEIALRRAVGATSRRMGVFLGVRAAGLGLAGTGIALVFLGPALWSAIAAVVPGVLSAAPVIVLRFAGLLVLAALAGVAPSAWRVLRSPLSRFLAEH